MTYYPKNKIVTGQSAVISMIDKNGEPFQYVLQSTKQIYEGYYYTVSDGKAYTGKYPGDGFNELLVYQKLGSNDIESPDSRFDYNSSQFAYAPTEEDYKKGFFVRYFYKKRNEFIFQELTKSEYDSINDPKRIAYNFNKPFFIKWMLTGDQSEVARFNQYSINTAEKDEKLYGLNEFLQMNYLQYYR